MIGDFVDGDYETGVHLIHQRLSMAHPLLAQKMRIVQVACTAVLPEYYKPICNQNKGISFECGIYESFLCNLMHLSTVLST